uniref:FP protein C-terminal domain-containing protein n=1 Tax=Heliothis virescens TaxID=7102 RepID=A0A2A4JWA7_HELVI
MAQQLPVSASSEPELNKLHLHVIDSVSTNRPNKRKAMDNDLDALFDRFSSNLTNKLTTLMADLEKKVSDIQLNITTVIKSDLDNIKSKLAVIDVNQSQLFTDMESVKTSIQQQDSLQMCLSKRVDDVSKSTATHSSDISRMQERITNLETELNSLQQRDRAFNLEVNGIPEKSNEKLVDYYCAMVRFLEIESSANDVVHAVRVRPVNPVPGRPKSIVIKLNSRLLRDAILSAVRNRKGLSTCDLGITGDQRKLFVNEHLTPANKLLHRNVREKASAAQYRFVWIRDGKIFVRKNDTSATIRITTSADLRKIM